MKKLFVLFVITAFFGGVTFAQLKLGHLNTQELLAAMPESDSAQIKLQKASKQLQDELELMQVEFNKKYQDYNAKMNTYSELIKQAKESELQDMNQRIQQFQQTAEQDIQKQRSEIFKPVLEKANKAISEVAKENKFTYIFDLSAGTVVYHAEESTDILPLVKAKLKLK